MHICICICPPNSRNLRSLAVPIPQTGTGPRSALVRGPAGRTMGGIPSSSRRCSRPDDSLRATPSAGRRHPSCHGLGSGTVYPIFQYLGRGNDPRGCTSRIARRIWSSPLAAPRPGRSSPSAWTPEVPRPPGRIWADSGRRRPAERRTPGANVGGPLRIAGGAGLGRRLDAVSPSFPVEAARGTAPTRAPASHSPRHLGNGQAAPLKGSAPVWRRARSSRMANPRGAVGLLILLGRLAPPRGRLPSVPGGSYNSCYTPPRQRPATEGPLVTLGRVAWQSPYTVASKLTTVTGVPV